MPAGPFGREELLVEYNISLEDFNRTGLSWPDLEAIAQHHMAAAGTLDRIGQLVAGMLSQVPQVHSLRVRVKDPEGLIIKIIRKKLADEEREINFDNYTQEITDLVGVRVLHITKEHWEPIHRVIMRDWPLHEPPVAYYRNGDPDLWTDRYKSQGCTAIAHPKEYRSVHYTVIQPAGINNHLVEIQVRTLYEEGWAELDHQWRYPTGRPSPAVVRQLTLLNLYAGAADQMAAEIFYRTLDDATQEAETSALRAEIERLQQEIGEYATRLTTAQMENDRFLANIEELNKGVQASPSLLSAIGLANGARINGVLASNGEMPTIIHLVSSGIREVADIPLEILGMKGQERQQGTKNTERTAKRVGTKKRPDTKQRQSSAPRIKR